MEQHEPIVYLGTEQDPKSCLGLEALILDGWNVQLVIAYVSSHHKKNPLFRIGRSILQSLSTSALVRRSLGLEISPDFQRLSSLCTQYNLTYCATSDTSLKSLRSTIAAARPAVLLSNGWSFKIRKDIFSLARLIALNCHSSHLPEYRGGNVTYAPLINGERTSGVTVHQLTENFDSGQILAQERLPIDRWELPSSLTDKRAKITGAVLIRALKVAGKVDLYQENPKSPFYYRCSYGMYLHYRTTNWFRKVLGLPLRRYSPNLPVKR